MIVYHVDGGMVTAYHPDGRDAPEGSYPGATRTVVPDEAFRALQLDANGFLVLPAAMLVPSADDVRAEAARRMIALTGARDAAHLAVLISNASREAIRLLRIKAERPWTAEEAARAAALEAADAAIEAIRAASNAMEGAPPADYRDGGRWP